MHIACKVEVSRWMYNACSGPRNRVDYTYLFCLAGRGGGKR